MISNMIPPVYVKKKDMSMLTSIRNEKKILEHAPSVKLIVYSPQNQFRIWQLNGITIPICSIESIVNLLGNFAKNMILITSYINHLAA